MSEKRPRLYLVEDSPIQARVMEKMLQSLGWQVFLFSHGLEAFSAISEADEEGGPDLVILDLELPGLEGLALCRLLKFHRLWQSIPVLVMTANTDPQIQQAASSMGADAFLLKPCALENLRSHLRRWGGNSDPAEPHEEQVLSGAPDNS